MTLSGIAVGRTAWVVHDIPMTNRAGVAAQDAAGRPQDGNTAQPSEADTSASVPSVPFGAWPSPITAADVARGRLRLSYPTVIAGDLEAYAQLAIALASDPAKVAAIRQKLSANRLTTPLFDTALFTRHLESAYTAMVERHRAGLPPDHINA